MSARRFKSVGWVAAVGGAALGCYMLSLQVATERNELAKVEQQILAAKQDIRSLQTELGTRGRLSQLERWNADVLALSAPASAQFLSDELTLARFDRVQPAPEEQTRVLLASADTSASSQPEAAAPPAAPVVRAAVAEEKPATAQPSLVRRASYTPPTASTAAPPKARSAPRLDDSLARELSRAAANEDAKPKKTASR
jgi:hypothetical protein